MVPRAPVIDRICMERYKQVGLAPAGNIHAFAVVDINVGVTDKNCPHATLRVDSRRQLSGYRQRDVLFSCPRPANRAWIVATMPRIDRNDDIAPWTVAFRCAFDGLQAFRVLQVDDQPIAVLAIGAGRETP